MRGRSTPKTVDEYLAGLSDDKKDALERLRATIRAAAPKAEEYTGNHAPAPLRAAAPKAEQYIGYQLPAFRLDGKPLVAFGATATHCSFYPMTGTTVDAFKEELKGYETGKGTIRFQAAKPLPATLVRKLVKGRIAENAARQRDDSKTKRLR